MSDIAIVPASSGLGNVTISKKPSYLILIEDASGKTKTMKKFITLDKPSLQTGFVEVRGFFTELSEEEIVKNLSDILTTTNKDLVLEVLIPWSKISIIRSLAFKQK